MIVKVYLKTCVLFFKLRMMNEHGYILKVRTLMPVSVWVDRHCRFLPLFL